jgi:hypothetical protein
MGAGEDVADDDLALGKKPGNTSDRSCSGTFNVSNLVSRLNISPMSGENAADRHQ